MNNPIRYNLNTVVGIVDEDECGKYVLYSDYEELKEENSRLKSEVERLTERNKFLEQIDSYLQGANEHSFEQRCNELEAEVEQLKEGNDCLGQMHDKEMERSAYLLEEFNRTTAWGRGLESDLSHAMVEISFLKSEVERLRASSFVTAVPVEQYERVVKAGDYLADHLAHEFGTCPSIEIWQAAKEGKPSV